MNSSKISCSLLFLTLTLMFSCQSTIGEQELLNEEFSNAYVISQAQQFSIKQQWARALKAYYILLEKRALNLSERIGIYYEIGYVYHNNSKKRLAKEAWDRAKELYQELPEDQQSKHRWVIVLSEHLQTST